ncbi:MAG: YihY/virulence factor BrkB family protein [Bdellovibrionales bacterium]|nr:YihY/virulence factor BrkB family protein [Bdellovibrionales bacterium]
MSSISNLLHTVQHFLTVDIWRLHSKQLTPLKAALLTKLRIILLAIRGFSEDKCQLRASALTFYSLLSIVPVFAMAFGIAKGFGFERTLRSKIYELFSGQQQVIEQVISFSDSLLENTRGGLIAGVGILVLFWTVIKLLGNIEISLNEIWGVKKHRSLGRKFADYLSIMLICPILVVLSSSLTVLVSSSLLTLLSEYTSLSLITPALTFALSFTPVAVLLVAFSFMYFFMPNTKVRPWAALLGGTAAAIGYHLTQWAYITFQVGIGHYGAVYGSFAALPLFLLWLQLSWLIVLFGAEVSYASQNVHTYEYEPDARGMNRTTRNLIALQFTHTAVHSFLHETPFPSAQHLSETQGVPIRLTSEILHELTQAGVLLETTDSSENTVRYAPAKNIDSLTIARTISLLEDSGGATFPLTPLGVTTPLKNSLENFRISLEKSPDNLPLSAILLEEPQR